MASAVAGHQKAALVIFLACSSMWKLVKILARYFSPLPVRRHFLNSPQRQGTIVNDNGPVREKG